MLDDLELGRLASERAYRLRPDIIAMDESARKRRAEEPEQRVTGLSMPFAAWAIVLAAVCLVVAYVILRPNI